MKKKLTLKMIRDAKKAIDAIDAIEVGCPKSPTQLFNEKFVRAWRNE